MRVDYRTMLSRLLSCAMYLFEFSIDLDYNVCDFVPILFSEKSIHNAFVFSLIYKGLQLVYIVKCIASVY